MEQAIIAALLEKYWLAETSVEEERQLAAYFRQPVIPVEWEPWRNVFAFFETEGQITPGADFEARLLERIRQVEVAPAPVRPLFRKAPWWAAAAVILLALGISRLSQSPARISGANGSLAQSDSANPASSPGSAATANDAAAIKDTYDDPQQALAAIRRALGTASAKMNRGRNITQKQIDRMNDGLQSAIAN
jgi:hypothetical protein